jgi:hypothetical protein
MAGPMLVSSKPGRGRRRTPDEDRALLRVVRGLKLLPPEVFHHTAAGIAFMVQGLSPEADGLAAQILLEHPE